MQSCKRSPQSVLSALWIYQRAIFSHMKKEGGSAGYPPVYTKKGNRTGKVGEFIKKHVFSDLRNLFIFFSIFFLLVLPSEDGTASTTYVCIQKSQNQRKVKFMTFFYCVHCFYLNIFEVGTDKLFQLLTLRTLQNKYLPFSFPFFIFHVNIKISPEFWQIGNFLSSFCS